MKLVNRKISVRAVSGVTLIELMVGLVIIGIGMTVAVPSFQGIIGRNQVATQVNEMLLAINLARSEASRRGSIVSVQAVLTLTGKTCGDSDNEFNCGWCVVPGNPANCNANVIRTFQPLSAGTTMNLVADQGATFLLFSPLGGVVGETILNIDHCADGLQGRRIYISPIGRSKSHKPDDPNEDRRPTC